MKNPILPDFQEFLVSRSLVLKGVNIREVQDLLGHKSVGTTMIYTHVMRDMKNASLSPLDTLYGNRR